MPARSPARRRRNASTGRCERLAGVIEAIGLHRRLLQRPLSGMLHLMIFVSFFVLFTAIVQAFGSGLFPGFSLAPIGGRSWIALLQDVFAVVMLARRRAGGLAALRHPPGPLQRIQPAPTPRSSMR